MVVTNITSIIILKLYVFGPVVSTATKKLKFIFVKWNGPTSSVIVDKDCRQIYS